MTPPLDVTAHEQGSFIPAVVITDDARRYPVSFGRLIEADRRVAVRFVARCERDTAGGPLVASIFCDRRGTYYCKTWGGSDGTARAVVQKLDGLGALHWMADTFIADPHFRDELRRAIDAPQFAFMDALTENARREAKRARKRNARNAAPVAVQLELATALVEVAGKLANRPTVENLAEAQRTVSALHRTLHAEELFRVITAA